MIAKLLEPLSLVKDVFGLMKINLNKNVQNRLIYVYIHNCRSSLKI